MKNIFNSLFNKKNRKKTISYLVVVLVYVVIEVLMNTIKLPRLFTGLLIPLCSYIVVSLALNLTVGFSGELSLGHAGFMSIGAFTAIIFSSVFINTVTNSIVRLIISIILGGLVSGIFGLIISVPVLKLSGDYLAIVTLAFGQIIKSLLNNVYLGLDNSGLHFSFVTNEVVLNGGRMLLSGPMGATDTQKISSFSAGIILILFTLFIIYSLINSKYGRAIMSCRDNQIASESVGISIIKTKTLAFVVSSILAGMAGALYALNYSTLQPSKFDFNTSILILVYVVFGGLANVLGTIISTSVLYVLPELLRSLQDYRMLIYSIVLIAIMLITNNEKIKQYTNKILESKKQK